jgi:serine/threonine protein phosphatase 1
MLQYLYKERKYMFFPIGDIHGCHDMMRRLYDKIVLKIKSGVDPENGGTIVFLGDYIDRNNGSNKVLDFLMSLEDVSGDNPIKHIILRGNHEEMMINARRNPDDIPGRLMWLNNGGEVTMDDFGGDFSGFLDGNLDNYVEWMENLPVIVQTNDYVFVHAGVNQRIPLDKQPDENCLWDQVRVPDIYKNLDKVIIHGHMPVRGGVKVDLPNNRIWMDVGNGMWGRLATICLPETYDFRYTNSGSRICPYEIIEVNENENDMLGLFT